MNDQPNPSEPGSSQNINQATDITSGGLSDYHPPVPPVSALNVDDFQYVFPNALKLALRITLSLSVFFVMLYLLAISLGARQHFEKSRAIDFVQHTELVLSTYQAASIPVAKLDSLLGAVRLSMTHHLADSAYSTVNLSRFYQGADQNYTTVKIDADTAEARKLIKSISALPDTTIRGYHAALNFDLKYLGYGPFERFGLYQFVRPADNFWNLIEWPAYYLLMICIAALLLTVVLITYDLLQKKMLYDHKRKILLAQANAGKPNLSWIDAQVMLQTYYQRNLQQNTWTFFLSVAVMALGFGLIFFGINTAIQMNRAYNTKSQMVTAVAALPDNKADTGHTKGVTTAATQVPVIKPKTMVSAAAPSNDGSSLITIVSTASGVIVNLIAGGFLALYNSTLKQGMDYTSSLQRTSTVGTSLAILETIDQVQGGGALDAETTAKIIDAKIAIAKQLIGAPATV